MNAYVYQAALLCEECGLAATKKRCADPRPLVIGDSDDFPQGPHLDGGGEADSPGHCDHCGVFLKNPLTTDGEEYVREELCECNEPTHICSDLHREWREHYSYLLMHEED